MKAARRSKPHSSTRSNPANIVMDDRISELPEPLKEKIIFALPTRDAIRMSFSSKHWQSAWRSLPVTRIDLDDSEDLTFIRRGLLNHEGLGDRQKIIVHFSLERSVSKEMTFADLDHWMKMVTRYCVEKLKLDLHVRYTEYKFPPTAFDVGSLDVLDLKHCDLDIALLIQKDAIFCRLRELSLWSTNFTNGKFGELLSRCPLLESLRLMYCRNLKHVELCIVPHLRNVDLKHYNDAVPLTVKIKAPNLESLAYEDISRQRLLNLQGVQCRNLKKLHVCHLRSRITNQYIDEVVDKFPSLEELAMKARFFEPADDNQLKITSRLLRVLRMQGETSEARNIIIDALNLVSYEHNCHRVSPSISFNSVKLEGHILQLNDINLDREWLLNLRTYLANCPPGLSDITLLVPPKSMESRISSKLEKIEIPQRAKVAKLSLFDISSYTADVENLVDGLLWSCQPREIRVSSSSKNFIKLIYEMLRDGGRGNCCWRHYLRSVTVEGFATKKDGTWCDYDTKNSTINLTHLGEANIAIFKLQWFDDLK